MVAGRRLFLTWDSWLGWAGGLVSVLSLSVLAIGEFRTVAGRVCLARGGFVFALLNKVSRVLPFLRISAFVVCVASSGVRVC